MTFNKVYIITMVNSAGISGRSCRESKLWHSADPEEVIRLAWSHYMGAFAHATADGILNDMTDTNVSFVEFRKTMMAGFDGGDDLESIQCVDNHIQFEASSISTFADDPMIKIRNKFGDGTQIITNRDYLVRFLAEPDWLDDGYAAYKSMVTYHIGCPYIEGDKDAYCHGKPFDFINDDNCFLCKEKWLDREVDS